MSQASHIGDDGWHVIAGFLDRQAAQSILLVTGKSMFAASGASEKLAPILAGRRTRRICEFETNPKSGDVRRMLHRLRGDAPYDAILAVGGGSVIDVSKLLKAFWDSEDPVDGYLAGNGEPTPAEIPLIAVPSTAGSGSEATCFAVVYQGETKHSVEHPALQPDLAVVIPSLLESLPRHVAASSGMDALCQGIESYWSIHSTEESRELASKAMVTAWQCLEPAVNDRDHDALSGMAEASHLAGKAINITRTTAPHAVSYALTTRFGTAHGHAVGVLMPLFLTYNHAVTESDCLDPRGPGWVRKSVEEIVTLLGCASVAQLSQEFLAKLESVGLEPTLKQLGVTSGDDFGYIIDNGFNPQRVGNNPRRLTKQALRDMLIN